MLVVMAIDHFGGPISKITYQRLGFFSAAEGFVFLSGLVFGLVYSNYFDDFSFLRNKARARVWTIYKYHMVLAVVFLIISYVGLSFSVSWIDEVYLFKNSPFEGILLAFALLYQPRPMSILPMYIVFILFAPYILIQFYKGRVKLILACSFFVWFLTQFNLILSPLIDLQNNTSIDLGFFNLFSWQVLFVVGLFVGYRKNIGDSIILIKNTWIILFIIVSMFILMLINNISMPFVWRLTNLQTLGVLRIVNFFLVVLFVQWLIIRKYFINLRWLVFLGKHSLQVFVFHVFILFLIAPFRENIRESGAISEVVVCLLVVSSLTLPGYLHKEHFFPFNI